MDLFKNKGKVNVKTHTGQHVTGFGRIWGCEQEKGCEKKLEGWQTAVVEDDPEQVGSTGAS